MDITNEYFSVARGGTFSVNDTTEVTKDFHGLLVSENAVFASLKVNGVDVKGQYILNSGNEVIANEIITCKGDDHFSGVQLVSGNVSIVLKA